MGDVRTSFKTRLASGDKLLGSMITLPSPAAAEILVELGYQWLFIDGEHGPLETAEVLSILHAVGDRVPCIVRVPVAAEEPIKKMLDLGAAGKAPPTFA